MTRKRYFELVDYIANTSIKLKDKYVEETDLPIDFLTIFSHNDIEFAQLNAISMTLGCKILDNNGPIFLLKDPILIPTGNLKILRIRKPDKERPQTGCDDFKVPDYHIFKKKYIPSRKNNLRVIEREEYEMIEIDDQDYDVLVYFPSEPMSVYLSLEEPSK
jgi:hypothetical protein